MNVNSVASRLQIIQSKLLSSFPEVCCGISTRYGGISPEPYGLNMSFNVGDKRENVIANRERFFKVLRIGVDYLAIPQQIHSDYVRTAMLPGRYESCDALITNNTNVFLVVTIADCLPIFLFDLETKSIGVVHAGWRGSQSKILEKTVMKMTKEFNVSSKNMICCLGPSAGVCCYEVGKEVAEQFPKKYHKNQVGMKVHFDMKSFNKDILLESGVNEHNIEVSEYCTICNPGLFHSYRRDGKNSGRMMGVIGLLSCSVKL